MTTICQAVRKKATPVVATVLGSKLAVEQLPVFWPTRLKITSSDLPHQAEVTFPLRGLAVRELLAWCVELEVLSPASIRNDVESRLKAGIDRYKLMV